MNTIGADLTIQQALPLSTLVTLVISCVLSCFFHFFLFVCILSQLCSTCFLNKTKIIDFTYWAKRIHSYKTKLIYKEEMKEFSSLCSFPVPIFLERCIVKGRLWDRLVGLFKSKSSALKVI